MKPPKIDLSKVSFSEKSEEILELSKKSLGFIPNMYRGMAGNTSTLDSYAYTYTSFRKFAGFNSVEQEVVLLSVAYANNCEYCMAAHSFVGDKISKVPTEITDAIRSGEVLPNAKLNALSDFTRQMVEKRGMISAENLAKFYEAGYDATHVLGVITGIAVKTLSNYSNHLVQPELDEVFAGRKWSKTSEKV